MFKKSEEEAFLASGFVHRRAKLEAAKSVQFISFLSLTVQCHQGHKSRHLNATIIKGKKKGKSIRKVSVLITNLPLGSNYKQPF